MQKHKKETKSTIILPVHSNVGRSANDKNENGGMRENEKCLVREVMKGKK